MSVMGLIAMRMLMDRKFHENVVMLAIGVAAVAVLGRERKAKMLAQVLAWDKRQGERYLRKAKKALSG